MAVTGGWGAFIGRWGGDPQRKSSARGAYRDGRGTADRRWGVVSGRAGRPRAAGAGGSAGGGWRLRGVEFDDKLQALDFVSNGWKI